jgi:hypothetical protein
LENIDETLTATYVSTVPFLIDSDVIGVPAGWSNGAQISVPRIDDCQ